MKKHKQIVPKKRAVQGDIRIEVDKAYKRFWSKTKVIKNIGDRHSVEGVVWVRTDIERKRPYSGHQTDLGT